MNNYNEIWTREKFLEYRKLKKSVYSEKMLIEHFWDDIYYSGIYNRKSSLLPWLQFIAEISITPEYSEYTTLKILSDIYPYEFDYIIKFTDKNIIYYI